MTKEPRNIPSQEDLRELRRFKARYEVLRKLNVNQFRQLWLDSLHGMTPFDDLVDDLVRAKETI